MVETANLLAEVNVIVIQTANGVANVDTLKVEIVDFTILNDILKNSENKAVVERILQRAIIVITVGKVRTDAKDRKDAVHRNIHLREDHQTENTEKRHQRVKRERTCITAKHGQIPKSQSFSSLSLKMAAVKYHKIR